MKIIYLHQYYKTPEKGGAIRSWHLSQYFVRKGHEVVMITAHNKKEATIEHHNGVTVHYLPVEYDNRQPFTRRIRAFIAFFVKALLLARKEKSVDLVLATSTPLTVGILAYFLKKIKGWPYIFEVRDLWPEVPVRLGIISNELLIKAAYKWEKRIYKHADHIVALSPAMKDMIKTKTATTVSVIPNMADIDSFENASISRRHSPFRIIYTGTFGPANNLTDLIKAAATCQAAFGTKVIFDIYGDGMEKEKIVQLAKNLELKNIHFHEPVDKSSIQKAIGESHMVYVSYGPDTILHTGSPNKFFDALAAGRCVLLNFEGWIKNIIEEQNCGFYLDQPASMPEIIAPYIENPESLALLEHNALEAAKLFSKTLATERYDSLLSGLKS